MVWRGSFQNHIMASGGTSATAVRMIQLDNECGFPARLTANPVTSQSTAIIVFIETSCMPQYGGPAHIALFPNAQAMAMA